MKQHLAKAIEYVRQNRTWDDLDEAVALRRINELRCSLDFADAELSNKIADLLDEYGQENCLPEDWWRDITDTDEVFFEI